MLLIIVALGAGFLLLFQQPSVGVQDIGDWGEVSDERTEIITTLWVDNQNLIGVSLSGTADVSYELTLNDVFLAEGRAQELDVPPGNETLTLSTEVRNQRIPQWWVNFIQNNETIPVRAEPSATVEVGSVTASPGLPTLNETLLQDSTPVSSALSQVASGAEGEHTETFSSDRVESRVTSDLTDQDAPNQVREAVIRNEVTVGYEIQRGWTTWGEVSQDRTVVYFHFLVHNPSDVVAVPAEPENLGATVEMNDVELFTAQGDQTTLQNPKNFTLNEAIGERVLAPGETKEVVYAVEMDNQNIDDWFVSHVQRDEQTDIRTEFQLVFSNGETTFRIPEDSPAAYTCELQTGILVNEQDTETTCLQPYADSDSDDDSDETTSTPTSTAIPTPTVPSPTNTPTPAVTPTPTDTPTPTEEPEPPTAEAVASPSSGEAPLTVEFDGSGSSDPDGTIEEYDWEISGPTPGGTGETITRTFQTSGEYTATLTVTDDDGLPDQDEVTVVVERPVGKIDRPFAESGTPPTPLTHLLNSLVLVPVLMPIAAYAGIVRKTD